MCKCVVESVIFTSHSNSKILIKKKLKRDFRAFSKAVISPCFSASGLSGKHESWGTRKAKAKVGSDESGQSGRKVTYEILMISYDILFFTLLVSPWYMYTGS